MVQSIPTQINRLQRVQIAEQRRTGIPEIGERYINHLYVNQSVIAY